MTLKERKYILNYDLGKNQNIFSGRLTTTSVDPNMFASTSAYTGYGNQATAYNKSIIPSAINKGLGGLLTFGTMATNFTSRAAANSANTANAVANGLIDNSGKYLTDAAANAAGASIGDVATTAGTNAALKNAGQNVVKTGLSTAGIAAGVLGAGMGVSDMINGAQNYNNRVHDSEMMVGSSTSTQSKFGRSYRQIGGFDENGILDYTNALNKADTTNMAMSGLNTGLSVGGLVGSIIPGVGTLIGSSVGGVLGALGGWLWGDSEAEERERKVKQDIANTKDAIQATNTQEEGVAGSLGLRDMYNATRRNSSTGILRADKGKVPSYDPGKAGVQGYMSKDETWYNPTAPLMEQVGYPGSMDQNVKDVRKDNVPLYGNIDPLSILGHTKAGNKYYADLGRPLGKRAEQIRAEYALTEDPYEQIQLMREMNTINKNVAALAKMQQDDAERKDMKHLLNYRRMNADKGKTPKFDPGRTAGNFRGGNSYTDLFSWLNPDLSNSNVPVDWRDLQAIKEPNIDTSNIKVPVGKVYRPSIIDKLGRFGQNVLDNSKGMLRYTEPLVGYFSRQSAIQPMINRAYSLVPHAFNSYVPNYAANNALRILGGLGYDPSAQLAGLNRVAGQNRYNINTAGNLSAGQRLMLLNNANNALYAQRGSILNDAYNKNATYKAAYADAMGKFGESAAARAQQALASQQDQYSRANAAWLAGMDAADKATYTNRLQTTQDFSTNNYQQKLLNLWDRIPA